MRNLRSFLKEEDGMGTVEVVLINRGANCIGSFI